MPVVARVLSAALVLALAPVEIAQARSVVARPQAPVAAPAVRMTIEQADGGGAFASAVHRGATFVAGEIGERYLIRLVNDSADRLEVVVTVDGRDVLSGKVGDFKRDRGYVLEPFGEVVIDGFRQSLDHVAAFRFSSVRDSYAVRRGTSSRSRSIGVVGVAVFRERPRPVARWHGRAVRPTDEASPSAKSAPRTSAPIEEGFDRARDKDVQLGTEFGETLHSAVVEVPFIRNRATVPDELHKVQYDSAERLAARGVPIDFGHEHWPAVDDGHGGWGHGGWPAARDDRFAPPPPPRHRR
jgi:hypothetical protein